MEATQAAHSANTAEMREKLISERVRRGFNRSDSATLLDELTRTFDPKNLPAALVYQGFAKPEWFA